jgi:IS5 family transposase
MNSYQPSFFDESDRYIQLDKLNDPLVELKEHIDFEIFREAIEKVFEKPKRSNAGRKQLDVVFMFKILLLQRLYNLSDEQVEFQINDRLSFCRFLGLPLGGTAPDYTTIWKFREALVQAGAVKGLFDLFTGVLEEKGLVTREGTLVDASFVEVPKQRNTKEENELVKKGETPDQWKAHPAKLRQKDLEARWTKKNGVSYFGYKDHVKADAASKLIVDYTVTDASVHDSQELFNLLGEDCRGESLFADSAYAGVDIAARLSDLGIDNFIHERAYKNRPLGVVAKQANTIKSTVRCLVEHIFGFIENSMNGPELRYIGFVRNEAAVGLCNLAYNLKRFIQLTRQQKQATA